MGYAAYCATAINALLARQDMANEWQARPQAAHLYLFNKNIHQWFHSPFFKDHDIVVVSDNSGQHTIAIDPSLYDYLDIIEVRSTH